MRIKIVNSIADSNGDQIPFEMVGKEYEVIKEDVKGVWISEGKLDAFIQYEEFEIVELNERIANLLSHYLKNTSKFKFDEMLKNMECTHLL